MIRRLATLLLAAGACALSGCGLKPIPYPAPTSEMPSQPGLFTGPSGQVTIYRHP